MAFKRRHETKWRAPKGNLVYEGVNRTIPRFLDCARNDKEYKLRFALPWGHLTVEMTQASAVINQKSF